MNISAMLKFKTSFKFEEKGRKDNMFKSWGSISGNETTAVTAIGSYTGTNLPDALTACQKPSSCGVKWNKK